jgi:murein DD-endopeptidase MepM/ murein hydrolase activator NlpD
MARRTQIAEYGRSLALAFAVAAPIFSAGCVEESPAHFVNPDRAETPISYEEPDQYFTVVVHRGDTIATIAARCDVSVATIERLNDLGGHRRLYPGQVLRVPSPLLAVPPVETRELKTVRVDDVPDAVRPIPRPNPEAVVMTAPDTVPEPQPRPDSTGSDTSQETASTGDDSQPWWSWWSKPGDEPAAESGPLQFIWPVRGRVIEPFGRGGGGERNDGINIAAAEGTPIHAAAAGTVTYAGNELKGYGNLVLIKHSDGYVTAYAHAQSIQVARGDTVEKGQVIGTAGATGDVDRPQLHFEIRHGVQPVDPARFLVADRAS